MFHFSAFAYSPVDGCCYWKKGPFQLSALRNKGWVWILTCIFLHMCIHSVSKIRHNFFSLEFIDTHAQTSRSRAPTHCCSWGIHPEQDHLRRLRIIVCRLLDRCSDVRFNTRSSWIKRESDVWRMVDTVALMVVSVCTQRLLRIFPQFEGYYLLLKSKVEHGEVTRPTWQPTFSFFFTHGQKKQVKYSKWPSQPFCLVLTIIQDSLLTHTPAVPINITAVWHIGTGLKRTAALVLKKYYGELLQKSRLPSSD